MDSSFMKLLDGTTPRTVLRSTLKHLDPVPTPMVLRNHGKRKRSQTGQRDKSSKQPKHDSAKSNKSEDESLSEERAQVSQISNKPAPEELLNTSSFRVVDQTYANITSTQDDSDINESIDLKAASRFQRRKDPNPLSQDRLTGGGSESTGASSQNESLHLSHSLGPNQTYANITSTQEQDSVSDGSINLEDASRFRRKKNPIMFSSVDADLNMSKGIGSEGVGVESGTANSSRRLADITYGNITSSQDHSISDGSINIEDATKFKKKKAPIAFSSIETDLNISGITSSQETQSSEGSIDIKSASKLRHMRTQRTLLSTGTDLSISNVTSSQGTQKNEADDSDAGLQQLEAAPHTSHIKEFDQTYGNISASQDASTVSDESINVEHVEKFKKKRDRIVFSSVDVDLSVSNLASQEVESKSSEEERIASQLSKDQSLNVSRADHEDSRGVTDKVMDISPVSPSKSRTETEKSPKKASPSSQALSSVKKLSPYEEVSKRRLEVSLVDVINESPRERQSLSGLMDKGSHGLELSHEHLQNLTQELLRKEKEGASQKSFNSRKPLSPSVCEELNKEQGSQGDKSLKEENAPSTWHSQDSSGNETEDAEKTSKNSENDVDIADDDEVISSTSDEDNVLDGEIVIGLVSSSQNKKLAEMEIKLIPETQESPVFQPGFEGSQVFAAPNTRDGVHQQGFEASQNVVVPDTQPQGVPPVVLESQETPMTVPAPLAGSVAPEAQTGPSVVPELQPELFVASEPHERSGATPGTQKPVAIPGIQEGTLVVPEAVEGKHDNLESFEVTDGSIPPPLGFRDADTKGLGPPAILDVKSAITNSDLLESIISDFNTVAENENGAGFEEEEKQRNEESRANNLDSLPFRVIEFDTDNSGMKEKIGKSVDHLAHGGIRPVGEAISFMESERDPSSNKVQSKEVVDTVPLENYGTMATDAPNLTSSDKVMPMNHDTLSTVTPQKDLIASPVGTPGGTDNNQSPKSRSPKKRPKHKPWSPKKKTPKEETPTQTLPKRGKRGEADTSDSISPQEVVPGMETPQKSGKANSSNITTPQRGSSKEKITPKSATPQRGRPRKENTPRTTSPQKAKPSKQTTHQTPSPKAGSRRRESMSGSESFHRRAGSRNTVFTKRHLVIEAEVHAPPDLVEDDGSSVSQKSDKESTLVSSTPAVSDSPQVMESKSTENMSAKVETAENTSANIQVVPDTQAMEEEADSTAQGQVQQESPVIASEAPIDNVPKDIDMKSRETRVKVMESSEGILNQAESEAEPSHSKEPEPKDIGIVHDAGSTQIKSDIINKENVEPNSSTENVMESSNLTNDDNLLETLSYGLDKQDSDKNHVELSSVSEKSQPKDAKDMNKSGSQSVLRRPDASTESVSSGRTGGEKNLKQLTMREFLKNLAKAPRAAPRHIPTVHDLMKSNHTKQEHVLKLPKATRKVKKDPQKTFSASKTREVLSHFARGYIKKETVNAAMEVSEQFFANMFYDLEALVSIRNRKTVSMKDMENFMRRLSLITTNPSLYALMQDHLPVDVWSTVIPVAYASNRIIPEPM